MKPAVQTLTFALDAGKTLRHVDDVVNGLACGCVCTGCGEQLVAKQGQKTIHHFAHASGSDCATGLETALHLAAKEILVREKRMQLPGLYERVEEVHVHGTYGDDDSTKGQMVRFDSVRDEVWLGGIIPDIVCTAGDRTLLVEVVVTHPVDPMKLEKIKAKGLAVLAVNLANMKENWDWNTLISAVITDVGRKKWLYNPKSAALLEKVQARVNRKVEIGRKEWEDFNASADALYDARRARSLARISFVRASQEFVEAIAMLNKFNGKDVHKGHAEIYRLLWPYNYRSVMSPVEKDAYDRLEKAIKTAIGKRSTELDLNPDERFELQNLLYRI